MFRRALRALASLALPLLCAGSAAAQVIHYVDANAAPGGNGASWATAFDSLDSALGIALPGEQIWVTATAIYLPTIQYFPGGPRSETFNIPIGVQLYGGFSGTETAPNQRIPNARTSLLGDIGFWGLDTDNCYHVVTVTGECTLDGFAVAKGRADGPAPFDSGAGIWLSGTPGQPTSVNLVDVVVIENVGARGAGLFAHNGKVFMQRCRAASNTATIAGGGMYFDDVVVRADNCTFEFNVAQNHGGGLFATSIGVDGNGRPRVELGNGLFHDNSATTGYGGGIFLDGSGAVSGKCALTYCTLSDNLAGVHGGGIYAQTSGPVKAQGVIENSIVYGNRLVAGPTDELGGRLAAVYSDCPLTTALGCFYANPQFVNGYDLAPGSPCADSGNAAFGPIDYFDLDGDAVFFEPIPLDITVFPGLSPGTVRPTGPSVSSGAYER